MSKEGRSPFVPFRQVSKGRTRPHYELEVLLADAMFGKNRMTEAGYDVDGNDVIEENELVDLQRLNYSTPGGMRRGEMQVPAGGFSRYAQSMQQI
jgi:hypothetical protein